MFDESGKYLYFLGSTNAGPVKEWFAQSNADMRFTSSLYLAVLRSNLPNPLVKESDEEKGVHPAASDGWGVAKRTGLGEVGRVGNAPARKLNQHRYNRIAIGAAQVVTQEVGGDGHAELHVAGADRQVVGLKLRTWGADPRLSTAA